MYRNFPKHGRKRLYTGKIRSFTSVNAPYTESVTIDLGSLFPDEEQLMSFNNLIRINNQHVQNKLDYLLIYLLWYLMTNKVHLLVNKVRNSMSLISNYIDILTRVK